MADAGTTRALAEHDPSAWFGVWGAWIDAWFWFPLFAFATLFTVLLYPNGLAGRLWRPLLWVSAVATGALTLVFALEPTLNVGDSTMPPCVAPSVYVPANKACQVQVGNPLNPAAMDRPRTPSG